MIQKDLLTAEERNKIEYLKRMVDRAESIEQAHQLEEHIRLIMKYAQLRYIYEGENKNIINKTYEF